MSPSWIWSDKITNERVARVGYNHLISNKGEWNNCFSQFSNRVLPPIFYFSHYRGLKLKTSCGKFLNLAHYFPYDVKLQLLAHSPSFLANQKARNAIVGAENLLKSNIGRARRSGWDWTQQKPFHRLLCKLCWCLFLCSCSLLHCISSPYSWDHLAVLCPCILYACMRDLFSRSAFLVFLLSA